MTTHGVSEGPGDTHGGVDRGSRGGHAHRCPDCKAEIISDLRSCTQCGADAGVWPDAQRTPLILPGNPALSVDVVRKRTSVPKIVVGATLSAALLGAALYYMPERSVYDPQAVREAIAAEAPSAPTPADAPVITAAIGPPGAEPSSADSPGGFAYGDTAVTRSVPSTPTSPIAPPRGVVSRRLKTVATAAVAPARTVPPPRVARAASVRRTAATQPAPTAAADVPAVTSSLVLTPIASGFLAPGERLELYARVIDQRTRRSIPDRRVEFTSLNSLVATVEPLSGLVVARAPGAVSIIIDGGRSGQITVRLTVSAPAPVVTVGSAPAPEQARTVAAAPLPTPARAAPALRPDVPDDGDVRSVVDQFISDVRRKAVRNFEVTQFLADGDDHRVMLVSGPAVISNTTLAVRVTFDLRFTKFDGAGRPVTRVSSIAMDIDKRNGQLTSSAVAVGTLRRP